MHNRQLAFPEGRKVLETRVASHPEAQLCGLDRGLAILETEAGAWMCPPGRCAWIPSGMVHSLRSCGQISGWTVRLDTSEGASLPAEPRILALSPLLKEIVIRMMAWVTIQRRIQRNDGWRMFCTTRFVRPHRCSCICRSLVIQR